MKKNTIMLALGLILFTGISVLADVPDQITYQGRLLYNGNPVTSATSIVFRLFQASSGGSAVWTETHGSVTPDSNGIYTEILGSTTAIPDDYDELWLELVVAGNVLTPRKKLTSAPFVLNAGLLSNLSVDGNLGIGTAAPWHRVQIVGADTVDNRAGLFIDQNDPDNWCLEVHGNYGLYVDGEGNIPLRIDGSGGEVVRVQDNGRVGIGTTNPGYELDVDGVINGNFNFIIKSGAVTQSVSEGTGSNVVYITYSVTFSTAFPNGIISVHAPYSIQPSVGGGGPQGLLRINNISKTGFTASAQVPKPSGTTGYSFTQWYDATWRAVGW